MTNEEKIKLEIVRLNQQIKQHEQTIDILHRQKMDIFNKLMEHCYDECTAKTYSK